MFYVSTISTKNIAFYLLWLDLYKYFGSLFFQIILVGVNGFNGAKIIQIIL